MEKPLGPQRPITKFALAHPVKLALASGLAGGAWCLAVVGDARAAVPVGLFTCGAAWWLWSPRGPARRREGRLFGEGAETDETPDS